MKNTLERKLRIENLTRCVNCSTFESCNEPGKESVVDCACFNEVDVSEQVTFTKLVDKKEAESKPNQEADDACSKCVLQIQEVPKYVLVFSLQRKVSGNSTSEPEPNDQSKQGD